MTDVAEEISEVMTRLAKATEIMKEAKDTDTARWQEAKAQSEELAAKVDELVEAKAKADREDATAAVIADYQERQKALMEKREPSKAWLIGSGSTPQNGYEPGTLIKAIFESRNVDYKVQEQGKATLAALGIVEAEEGYIRNLKSTDGGTAKASWTIGGKATLGTSTATGLAIVPNNVVDSLVTIATAENIYRRLMTWIPGVATAGVDIPVEAAIPLRAVVAAFGSTKENVDITYLRYTATLYTISRIHDVGNQLLRFSAGAAEQDVVSRLGRAFGLGEAYYITQGAGTTEPKGLLTSIGTTGSYVTTDSSGFATPAASVFGAISSALGTLENRARQPDAIVMNPGDFWTYLALEGGTSRPYAVSLLQGLGSNGQIDEGQNPLVLFGLPVFRDPNMPAGSALLGEFRATRVFTGLGYRIDSSSEAGTRWDVNVTGFRGEEELGFNADSFVNAGMFQRIVSVGT